jgi:hypothetical protein
MRIGIGLALGLTMVSTLAHAQTAESERRQSCMGDAFRFCASAIPDRREIARCLNANRDQVSPECRNVLDAGRNARSKAGG